MSSNYTRDNIIALPHPHLRQRSKRVTEINDRVKTIIKNMIDATLDWEKSRPNEVAVALAAIQIDEAVRVIIVREDFDDRDNQSFTILINPEIIKYEGEIITDYEGCLSVKNVYGKVPRHSKIRCRAVDINGNAVKFKTHDPFTARVIQHEIDHMNGICFVDHISHDKTAFYKLLESGELEPVSYEDVQQMDILVSDEENNAIL